MAEAKPSCRLHVLSHPDTTFHSLPDGVLFRSFIHHAHSQAKLVFTATFGSSGGLPVDDLGNVVGVVSSTLAIHAGDERPTDVAPDFVPEADFQLGLTMCVPAADTLRFARRPEAAD